MTYGMFQQVGFRGNCEVFCSFCRASIGTMTLETIARAGRERGPLLCPHCRRHKCDWCGEVGCEVSFECGQSGNRVCSGCYRLGLSADVPDFTLKLVFSEKPTPIKEAVLDSPSV